MNNDGFTLLEMIISFALLGILLVAAAQIISSSTQVYYYTKSVTYGIQASQVVATEVRGDLEEALPLLLKHEDNDRNVSKTGSFISSANSSKNYSVYISDDGRGIAFINNDEKQVLYWMKTDSNVSSDSQNPDILVRREISTNGSFEDKEFTTQYVGMDYKVKDIKFSLLQVSSTSSIPGTSASALPGYNSESNYPVIQLDITVSSEKYGVYDCIEYIPLYNFYGIDENGRNRLIHN